MRLAAAVDELAEARDTAIVAAQQKAAFLATMSHEIRTPLNGLVGLNDLLLRTDLDTYQEQLLNGADASGRTLLRLVRTEMEAAYPLDVPLRVETKLGDNWRDVEPTSGSE